MSTMTNAVVPCRTCGRKNDVVVASIVNVEESPEVRQAVLERRFHEFACRSCQAVLNVEKDFRYVDIPRRQWIGVSRVRGDRYHREFSSVVLETFNAGFLKSAPALAEEWRREMKVRAVFGVAQLREKLVCWDAGLDDVILELMKIDLIADNRELEEYAARTLLLDAVIDNDLFFWVVYPPGARDGAPMAVCAPREIYEGVATALPTLREAHAQLLQGPYVNVLRYREANTTADSPVWDPSVWTWTRT